MESSITWKNRVFRALYFTVTIAVIIPAWTVIECLFNIAEDQIAYAACATLIGFIIIMCIDQTTLGDALVRSRLSPSSSYSRLPLDREHELSWQEILKLTGIEVVSEFINIFMWSGAWILFAALLLNLSLVVQIIVAILTMITYGFLYAVGLRYKLEF